MCQCKKCDCKPKLDWTKPVRTKEGRAVRILCTDGPHSTHPVYGFIEGLLYPSLWTLDGVCYGGAYHLENVPPEPVKVDHCLYLTRNKRNGVISMWSMWKDSYSYNHELLGKKIVTVTEGEGL